MAHAQDDGRPYTRRERQRFRDDYRPSPLPLAERLRDILKYWRAVRVTVLAEKCGVDETPVLNALREIGGVTFPRAGTLWVYGFYAGEPKPWTGPRDEARDEASA